MNVRVLALVFAAGAFPSTLSWARPPVKIKDYFTKEIKHDDWAVPPVNLHVETDVGLVLGPEAEPAVDALGYIEAVYAEGSEPRPDVEAEAVVNLGDGWVARSVTIRVQRDSSGDKVMFARVTAWKANRTAAVTKVRLTLGAKIKVDEDHVWRYATEEVDDDTTTGTLKLSLNGTAVEATFEGKTATLADPLEDAGEFINLFRLELQGDPALVNPAVESIDAQSP